MRRKTMAVGLTLAVAMGIAAAALTAEAAEPPQAVAPTDPLAFAISSADRAAASGLDALAKGPFEQYDRHMVTPWFDGMYSVAYQRTYRGLPVVGGDAVVLADGQGTVRAMSSATSAKINVSTRPRIRAAAAEATSRRQLATVDKMDSQRLVVLVRDNITALAWETVLLGQSETGPSRRHVFVDARTGKVLAQDEDVAHGSGTGNWNGPNPLTIQTSGSAGSYRMTDTTRPGLSCRNHSTSSVLTGSDDVWGNGNGTSIETGCVDALYGAQTQWNMLSQWLGRNGVNGNGGSFPVNVGLNDQNAYWDGTKVAIGKNTAGEWISSMDVIAHEYGHGIDSNTPGGTSGQESGLGEATGDIFGALTEHFANQSSTYDEPDYLVGEEIDLVGSGPIRNMYNPGALGDPNCYSSSIPGTETHAAAGPMNHWFYLLAEGSNPGGGKPSSATCNGSTVVGIGIQDAGRIFMGAMLLKTSSMTYKKYRTATLTSAKNLDPSCNLYNKTKAAWDAVSVPAQSADPTCTGTPGNDFSLNVSPTSGSVQPGSAVSTTVSTTTTSGNPQTVSLAASGTPTGVSVSFNPSSVQSGSSSTMTISASSSAPSGTYSITVTGTGSLSHTAQYTLTVGTGNPPGAPDINLANVQAHLSQFGTIASQNGGNRRAGSSGYTASLAYVKAKLQAAGYTVTEQYCSSCTYPSNNLIADWPGGPANEVIMLGAHLDGVSAGPGINDNASGSSVLLENALVLAQQNPTMTKHVRFAWWTDEEQGLNGSEFYVDSLSSTQRGYIKGYYNFDMVASPNAGYFINRVTSTTAAPLKAYWDSLNLQPEENTEGQGRSDDYSFQQAGIPTSGYAMGASAAKTSSQASKWGGTAGSAYDPCYHRSCDTTSNINATAVNRAADGVAYAIWNLAVGTQNPTDDFSISVNPVSGSADKGASVTTTVATTTTSGSAQTIGLSASGAPSGVTVSFSPSSVQSGQSSTATISVGSTAPTGSYTITLTGSGTVSHSTTFTLTVNGTGGGCSVQVGNGGFENGTSPWTGDTGSISAWSDGPAHSGTRFSWLAGYGYTESDTISQVISIPSGCSSVTLRYWIYIDTNELTATYAYDKFTVKVNGSIRQTLSNLNAYPGYVEKSLSLSSYAGQQITLSFTGAEDYALQTSFLLDDVSLQVS